jgi:hypothetical protein
MQLPGIPSSLASSVAQASQPTVSCAKATSQTPAPRARDEFIASIVQADAADPDAKKEHDHPQQQKKKPAASDNDDAPRIDITG